MGAYFLPKIKDIGGDYHMAIDDLERRFGSVAIKKGFITSEQLIEAITSQVIENVESHQHRLIGSILHEKGFMTIEQINEVLKSMM
jgi:hypothetical protein